MKEFDMQETEKQDKTPGNEPEMVTKAEYERLRLEMTAERLLAEAGAKNLRAARALLDLSAVDLQAADWAENLRRQILALRRRADTAFLFAHDLKQQDYRWLGLVPQAAADTPDVYGADGGYGWRLAQAEGVEAIKIKQEAAAQGIML